MIRPVKETDRIRKHYQWEKAVPDVEDFFNSGINIAIVESEDADGIRLMNRLKTAVWHLNLSDKIAVLIRRVDNGEIILLKRKDME